MLDYPPGSVCQPGLFHLALDQYTTLVSAGLDPPECDHRLYVTDTEGLQVLLAGAPSQDDDQLDPPTITPLSNGLLKLNSSVPAELYTKDGRLVGPAHDARTRHAIRDYLLGVEPPETPLQILLAAEAARPITASLLVAEVGPVMATDPLAPTLISGPTKVGKTSAAAAMLAARKDVPAIWLTGEGIHWTHQRLHESGAHNVTIAAIPRDRRGTKALGAVVEDLKPEIAVLDPYSIAAVNWGYDTNHDTTAGAVLQRVREITGKIPTIIVAHDRKSSEHDRAGALVDRVRGSGALPGVASVILRVTKIDNVTAQVRTIGFRYGPTPPPWTLDLATLEWSSASRADVQRSKILTVLERALEPMSCRQISTEIGARVNISDLDQLTAEGHVHKSGERQGWPLWSDGPPQPQGLFEDPDDDGEPYQFLSTDPLS